MYNIRKGLQNQKKIKNKLNRLHVLPNQLFRHKWHIKRLL